jgi:hypothetical protein
MAEFLTKKKTAAFTVVTPNYLAHAYSLHNTFMQHNPGAEFIICLVGNEELLAGGKNYSSLYIAQLKDDRINGMLKRYNPFELSCALKPFFAHHIFTRFTYIDHVIYLDADILVFGEFKIVSNAAIVLSPHRTANVNYLPGTENFSSISLLRYGVYNAGYFELLRNTVTFDFLKWWQDLMEKFAYNNPDEHQFIDQLWLTAVPSFFDDFYINKGPGYNMAYWNFLERKVTSNGDGWLVNGEPLVCFHYSGYNIEEPEKMVNFDHPFLSFTRFPELKPIFEKFRKSLLENGYEETKNLTYPFSYKQTGKKKGWWRKLFF